jgi:hypothetical protein
MAKKKFVITVRISAVGIRKIVVDGYPSIKTSALIGKSLAVFVLPEDLELTSGLAKFIVNKGKIERVWHDFSS